VTIRVNCNLKRNIRIDITYAGFCIHCCVADVWDRAETTNVLVGYLFRFVTAERAHATAAVYRHSGAQVGHAWARAPRCRHGDVATIDQHLQPAAAAAAACCDMIGRHGKIDDRTRAPTRRRSASPAELSTGALSHCGVYGHRRRVSEWVEFNGVISRGKRAGTPFRLLQCSSTLDCRILHIQSPNFPGRIPRTSEAEGVTPSLQATASTPPVLGPMGHQFPLGLPAFP